MDLIHTVTWFHCKNNFTCHIMQPLRENVHMCVSYSNMGVTLDSIFHVPFPLQISACLVSCEGQSKAFGQDA